jgi:hypothetical protein
MSRAARLLVLSRALAKKGQEETGSIKLTWAKRLLKEASVERSVCAERRLLMNAFVENRVCRKQQRQEKRLIAKRSA